MMPRQDVNSESREGLLHSEQTYALQSSLDDACRSSTDSDDRLDSLDLNTADKAKYAQGQKWSWIPRRPPWSSGYTYEESQAKSMRRPARHKGIKDILWRWKTCCVIILILALGIMTLVGTGALWVYKAVPVNGVGGAEWESKAFANVSDSNHLHGIPHLGEAQCRHGKKAIERPKLW
jgi:hypothetical protein